MGVHGLRHLIETHYGDCLVTRYLHDCAIIIDGSNLAYRLYLKAPGVFSATGGDYAVFARYVSRFFARLRQCRILATVLLDGGQPLGHVKTHTCTTRLQTTIDTSLDVLPSTAGHTRVLPLHARAVFLSVLRSIDVPVLQCHFEADEHIAYLARKYNAVALSNDSDFLLMDVQVALLSHFNTRSLRQRSDEHGNKEWAVPCKLFNRHLFCQRAGLRLRDLPLIAAFSGCDVVPPGCLAHFHSCVRSGRHRMKGHTRQQQLLQLVIKFIARNKASPMTLLVDQVVKACSRNDADIVKKTLMRCICSYKPSKSSIEFDIVALWRRYYDFDGDKLVNGDNWSMLRARQAPFIKKIDESSAKDMPPKPEVTFMCECEKIWLKAVSKEWHLNVLCATDVMCGETGETSPSLTEDELESGNETASQESLYAATESEELISHHEKDSEKNDEEKESLTKTKSLLDMESEAVASVAFLGEEGKELMSLEIGTNMSCDNSVEDEKCAEVSDILPPELRIENWEKLSKNQKKKEVEKFKHLQRMKKKFMAKEEVRLRQKALERQNPSRYKTNVTGMDAQQVIRYMERLQKEPEVAEDRWSLSDFVDNDISSAAEEYCSDISSCSHKEFSLPGWLVYGYSHGFIGREIFDIVCNNFCIAPAQIEQQTRPSVFESVRSLFKLLVYWLKFLMPEDKSAFLQNVPEKINNNQQCRKRQNDRSVRWYIRDGRNLLIDKISLQKIINDNNGIPCHSNFLALPLHGRKHLILEILFLENSVIVERLMNCIECTQYFLCAIVYWYKNCNSSANELHILTLVITYTVLQTVYKKVPLPSFFSSKHCCFHCVLTSCCDKENCPEDLLKKIHSFACRTHDVNKRRGSVNLSNKEYLPPTTKETSSITVDKLTLFVSESPRTTKCEILLAEQSLQECTNLSERLTGFHSARTILDANYNVDFVHSMSEFQACVHYFGMINAVALSPFKAVNMENLWSGTFAYNIFSTLQKYGWDNVSEVVCFLLNVENYSVIYQLCLDIYSILVDILDLKPIRSWVGTKFSSVAELFLANYSSRPKPEKKIRNRKRKANLVN